MERLLFTLVLPFWLSAQPISPPPPPVAAVLVDGKTDTIHNISAYLPDWVSHYSCYCYDFAKLNSSQNLTVLLAPLPAHHYYYYHLEGYNDTFQRSEDLLLFYPALKQRLYYLNIYTETDTGVKSEPLKLRIYVNSSWRDWLAWIVTAVVVAVALLFSFAFYVVRLTNFRSKNEMQTTRKDWSRRLHADLGIDVSTIAGYVQILQTKITPLEPDVEEIFTVTHGILDQMRVKLPLMYNAIDPDKNGLPIILRNFEVEAKKIVGYKGINLDYKNQLDAKEVLKIDARRIHTLYQAMKEAVGNIAKHSQATDAAIHIQREKIGILIAIRDNGKGFDLQALHAGNGLKDFKRWEKEGLMNINVIASPGEGTRIVITVPEL